jgi:hypothetical protein
MTNLEAICDWRTSEGLRRRRAEGPGVGVWYREGRRCLPGGRPSWVSAERVAAQRLSSNAGAAEGAVRLVREPLVEAGTHGPGSGSFGVYE